MPRQRLGSTSTRLDCAFDAPRLLFGALIARFSGRTSWDGHLRRARVGSPLKVMLFSALSLQHDHSVSDLQAQSTGSCRSERSKLLESVSRKLMVTLAPGALPSICVAGVSVTFRSSSSSIRARRIARNIKARLVPRNLSSSLSFLFRATLLPLIPSSPFSWYVPLTCLFPHTVTNIAPAAVWLFLCDIVYTYDHTSALITTKQLAGTSTMPSFDRLLILAVLALSVSVQSAPVGGETSYVCCMTCPRRIRMY